MGVTPTGADARAALERFVVDNDDLLQLESLIGRFNIFDALGVARAEIRHSNFLAFLLDPAESHGQSAMFLRALLMDLLKSTSMTGRHLSPIEVDGADLRGVEVQREWKHIDLLITSERPALVVVIENKVDAGENGRQLDHYYDAVEEEYPTADRLYVYLTRDGVKPTEAERSKDMWLPYSYRHLHRVLCRVRATNGTAIGDDVAMFLDHYLHLIGTRFMDSPEIDDLCRRIYKNHRQALQLIYDRVGRPASGVIAEVEAALEADGRWHVFKRLKKLIRFVPTEWLQWLPKWAPGEDDGLQSWLAFRFEAGESRITCYAKVGEVIGAHRTERQQVVTALLSHWPSVGLANKVPNAAKIDDRPVLVLGKRVVTKWPEQDDPDPEIIRQAVRKELDELYARLHGTPAVLRPFLQPPDASAPG